MASEKKDTKIKPGEVRNPKGRPVGSRNKKDVFLEAITAQAIEGGITPLDFMLDMLRRHDMPLGVRFECAKAAAPYCHRKMPIAVEVNQEQFKVFDPTQLQGLTLEEMQQMAKLLRKAHDAEMDAMNGGVTMNGTAQRVVDSVRAIEGLPIAAQVLNLPGPKPKPKPQPKVKQPWNE